MFQETGSLSVLLNSRVNLHEPQHGNVGIVKRLSPLFSAQAPGSSSLSFFRFGNEDKTHRGHFLMAVRRMQLQ